MRHAREILRQKFLLRRSHRAIAKSVGVSAGVVSLAAKRAATAALDWQQIETLDDRDLAARLYPAVVLANERVEPDCAWIHRERHRPGVTLELLHHEYLEEHPGGLKYTSCCDRYRALLRGATLRLSLNRPPERVAMLRSKSAIIPLRQDSCHPV
jgi:hypothetical protein